MNTTINSNTAVNSNEAVNFNKAVKSNKVVKQSGQSAMNLLCKDVNVSHIFAFAGKLY